jgi:hypothetical protein
MCSFDQNEIEIRLNVDVIEFSFWDHRVGRSFLDRTTDLIRVNSTVMLLKTLLDVMKKV